MTQIHATGNATDETSYYDALTNLLNEVGVDLHPPVKAVMTIKNRGAGIPDGGLFTFNQYHCKADLELSGGSLPARGALEVKPLSLDVSKVAETDQVTRYLEKYGQVLVINYRDFLLVGKNCHGKRWVIDRFSLASSESEFWKIARLHDKTARDRGDALHRFLERCMVRPAPITTPEDLAWLLAHYAQEALSRIQNAPVGTLDNFKESLEEALGIKFDEKKSLNFFYSTLVQTLFYGIFSGWVMWCRENDDDATFDWREAAWTLHLPAIKSLFAEVATPVRITSLDIRDVLDWTGEALSRVDRKEFFARFSDPLAIQYFYEPFLESYDPELRKEMGVWYTPPEIVHYIVERIDKELRDELGIENGFANEDVYVLDPCAGTGSFLLEVLRRIQQTGHEAGEQDFLVAKKLKIAAMERIFGFEILPAPFVVAHLQVGLLLRTLGAPLNPARDERAGIFLTNSLTGWEPPKGPQKRLTFIELQEERAAADSVKRDNKILVVLGNPPYNAYAGTSPEEERGLVDPYKAGLRGTWKIKKYNLDEFYVRFMRIAERQIAEHTKQGIICYISSYSYLSDPSFVIMRERLYEQFDKAWIDSLNGDSRETGKRTPDGLPDPSIFSTERNREGIRLGTSVGLFVKKATPANEKQWRYRDFWGTRKREDLIASLSESDFNGQYNNATPKHENKYNFRPVIVSKSYYAWPSIKDLCRVESINGLLEMRGSSLIQIDVERLRALMQSYYDKSKTWEEMVSFGTDLTRDAARFNAIEARARAQRTEKYDEQRVVRYVIRPFDCQHAYYTAVRPLWNEPRLALWAQLWPSNEFFVSRRYGCKIPEGPPFYWTSRLFDYHILAPNAAAFPTNIKRAYRDITDFTAKDIVTNNYSEAVLTYLEHIGIKPDNDSHYSSLVWLHALAVGFSPKYLRDNRDGIKQDWPHIPLPNTAEQLQISAQLGRKLADFLDSEKVSGLTIAPIRAELDCIGLVQRKDGNPPVADHDLEVNVVWGRPQQGGVFPGPGKTVLRDYSNGEMVALESGAKAIGVKLNDMTDALGRQTYDVYLNAQTYWRNVPQNVWDYYIGGNQVIKKWLSYRETVILGRPITAEEAVEVTGMTRRIAAIILMQPALNANYDTVKNNPVKWP
jgi:hypothetical protein